MSYLVTNPEDRFSRDEAPFITDIPRHRMRQASRNRKISDSHSMVFYPNACGTHFIVAFKTEMDRTKSFLRQICFDRD